MEEAGLFDNENEAPTAREKRDKRKEKKAKTVEETEEAG